MYTSKDVGTDMLWQTNRVPPNVRFEIDDVEEPWTYHQKFDYIHCRFMGNGIKDWPKLLGQCLE